MDNEKFSPDSSSGNNNSHNKPRQLNPSILPVRAALIAVFAVFLLYQFVGGTLALIIFGSDISSADINAQRLFTMGGQILFILVPALWFSKRVYEDVPTVIRLKLPNYKEVAVFILGFIILSPLLQNFLYIQNYVLEELTQVSAILSDIKDLFDKFDAYIEKAYGALLKGDNIFEIILIVVVVAFTPAICEEVFFRGFIQKSFELQMKPWIAILLTSAFFGLYHFNPYGLIALIILGFYFGYAAYLSDSIVIPMVLHFLNNFFQILVFHIFDTEEFSDPAILSAAGFKEQFLSFVFLLILFSLFIYYVSKYYHKIRGTKNDLPKV